MARAIVFFNRHQRFYFAFITLMSKLVIRESHRQKNLGEGIKRSVLVLMVIVLKKLVIPNSRIVLHWDWQTIREKRSPQDAIVATNFKVNCLI